jgi:hypothetical protein
VAGIGNEVRRILLRPTRFGNLIRLAYGTLTGQRAIASRARFHLRLLALSRSIRQDKLTGGEFTAAGE